MSVEEIEHLLMMKFQFHDLGRLKDNGDFVCSAVQIGLLEALCAEAAREIAALSKPQPTNLTGNEE